MKPGSKAWKAFMAKLYGFGAAVVIIGAMFKIMHWPGAGIMLVAGLSTEALIFIFSAFEPIHEDPDWTLVYPELALGHDEDHDHDALPARGGHSRGGGTGITEELDKLLEEARQNPDPKERQKLYSEIQGLLNEISPMIYIHHEEYLLGVSEKVTGLEQDATATLLLQNVEIE